MASIRTSAVDSKHRDTIAVCFKIWRFYTARTSWGCFSQSSCVILILPHGSNLPQQLCYRLPDNRIVCHGPAEAPSGNYVNLYHSRHWNMHPSVPASFVSNFWISCSFLINQIAWGRLLANQIIFHAFIIYIHWSREVVRSFCSSSKRTLKFSLTRPIEIGLLWAGKLKMPIYIATDYKCEKNKSRPANKDWQVTSSTKFVFHSTQPVSRLYIESDGPNLIF